MFLCADDVLTYCQQLEIAKYFKNSFDFGSFPETSLMQKLSYALEKSRESARNSVPKSCKKPYLVIYLNELFSYCWDTVDKKKISFCWIGGLVNCTLFCKDSFSPVLVMLSVR